MFTANIKRNICLLLSLNIALFSCGCRDNRGISACDADITGTSESDAYVTADTVDGSVPEQWLAVYTTEEALNNYDEILNCDYSDDEIADVILALVNRNVLFMATIMGKAFEIQWDNPTAAIGSEAIIYPVESVIFSDLSSIYDFADNTYSSAVVEKYLLDVNGNGSLFAVDGDNRLCVNTDNISNWSSDPFFETSYIEITSVCDDCCGFIWHFPDVERLNEPQEGMEYFYYEMPFTTTYNGGNWLLDNVIFNNWDILS